MSMSYWIEWTGLFQKVCVVTMEFPYNNSAGNCPAYIAHGCRQYNFFNEEHFKNIFVRLSVPLP